MSSSADQARFEATYADLRDRLLVQTFALTGDLAASQRAVRDAFVIAWHHWAKVSGLADPEGWIRPLAWSHAQRRHTARIFHRDRRADPGVSATLAALADLSPVERKVLLLAHLTRLDPDQLARETGVTQSRAVRELQSATGSLAAARGVAPDAVPDLFAALAGAVEGTRWPRPTILVRAGRARRRTHTGLGAAAAVATLLVSGALVTDAAGVRPDLGGKDIWTATSPGADRTGAPRTAAPTPEPELLPADSMLSAGQVSRALRGRWAVGATTFNADEDGLSLPCQRARYADADGLAVLLRTFGTEQGAADRVVIADPRDGAPAVAQLTEISSDAEVADRAFDTAMGWFTGCTDPRTQLLDTLRVTGVGDRAGLVLLRDWSAPERSVVVGVARTGALTTIVVGAAPGGRGPTAGRGAALLGRAVDGVCRLPEASGCTTVPRARHVAPPPVSAVPSVLAEVDLPPVRGVSAPWFGAPPTKVVGAANAAATRCDDADFGGRGISAAWTRTFVIPQAKRLPVQFGLTETTGTMSPARAKDFVRDVRKRLGSCAERQLGTEVSQVRDLGSRRTDLAVWRVTVKISDTRSVSYLMALVRKGGDVAQVGFIPAGDVEMAPGAFAAVAERALDRLGAAPPD